MANQLMTQRDRTELRRILKARFNLLSQQLSQREQELRAEIAEQIREQYKTEIKAASKDISKLKAEAFKLEAKAKEVQDKLADKGIGISRYNYNILDISIREDLEPLDLNSQIERAYQKLRTEAGLHKMDLGLAQLQLEEELAIGALSSDEAKDFLGKVPSIDTLLPSNVNIKAAIEGAAKEEGEDGVTI